VIYAVFLGNMHSIVFTAVVNYQPLYPVKAGNLTRQGRQRNDEGFSFVKTRDLDDEFQSSLRIAAKAIC
jgi:hypothetical protein